MSGSLTDRSPPADDRHRDFAGRPRLRVAVSGASGLVGSALSAFLSSGGHRVCPMVRGGVNGPDVIPWDPGRGRIDASRLAGVDAVVHLAGENVAAGRWTEERKRRIRGSRIAGTRLVAEAMAGMTDPPSAMICASAIGYYGDRGDEVLDETSAPGKGFLAATCRAWEAAADPARDAGVRVVHMRIGVVVAAAGGALAKLLLPFRLGLGGPVGPPSNWMSWVALDDVVGAFHHALFDPALEGPANLTAPNPVTNREFARTLGRVLSRPAILPVPSFALRIALGRMADELLLAGQRVVPRRLEAAGFRFRLPDLEAALRFELGRPPEERDS